MNTAIDWEPLDFETIRDPYPFYRRMLTDEPVFWHEQLKSWVVAGFEDCKAVLRNHEIFARDRRRVGVEIPEKSLNIQTQDPPAQAELRQAVLRVLHSQDVRGIAAIGRRQIEERIAAKALGEVFDFVTEIAEPVSLDLINRVVGVHDFTVDSYRPIFVGLTKSMDSGLDPSRVADGATATVDLRAAMQRWFAKPNQPGVIADLQADPKIGRMPPSYVHNTIAGVYNAGFSTSAAAISSIVLLLASQPGLLERIGAGGTFTTAAHEFLRYISPAQATARVAVVDTQLGNVPIRAGQTVVTLMAAANRDPAVFADPDSLVLGRSPNPHLAFAWGPHICVGAQLAIGWIAQFLRFVREGDTKFVPAGEPEYMHSATLRTLTKLPVQLMRR